MTMPTNGKPPDSGSDRKSWAKGLSVGSTILASVLLGLGIGYAVDEWLDTGPYGMVVGSALFIVAGLYQVVKEFS